MVTDDRDLLTMSSLIKNSWQVAGKAAKIYEHELVPPMFAS